MPKGLQAYCSYECREKATRRRTREKKKETPGYWMDKADKIVSLYYRSQTPYCEAKGLPHEYKKDTIRCTSVLQWCHVFSRRYKGIRYEPYNNIIMCSAHHSYFTVYPEEWAIFMALNFPEKWKLASENRNRHCNATVEYFKSIIEAFTTNG